MEGSVDEEHAIVPKFAKEARNGDACVHVIQTYCTLFVQGEGCIRTEQNPRRRRKRKVYVERHWSATTITTTTARLRPKKE